MSDCRNYTYKDTKTGTESKNPSGRPAWSAGAKSLDTNVETGRLTECSWPMRRAWIGMKTGDAQA